MEQRSKNQKHWQTSVERFVGEHLPEGSGRVLEVGCGRGELAMALTQAGHRVLAVDPEAPDGPIFERRAIEDLRDRGPFGAVIACLSLHHVDDPGAVLDQCRRLLAPGGRVIVVEFARERVDEPTVEWYLARLGGDGEGEPGWLDRHHQEWVQAGAAGEPAGFVDWFQRRSEREGLHEGAAVLRALRRRFAQQSLTWGPYLYLDLNVSEADEAASIASGAVRATSFRFVGRRER